jgi:EmrB/QacA subfamily drug resistance transporter
MERTSRGRPALCLLLTSVAFFMAALDALVVVTALPAIHRSLGGSLTTLEWAVNGYALTCAAGMITAAALGDRLGRRRMYVTGLTLFSVASAACALAPSADTLIAARAVQGLGAATVTPLSLTILTSTFPASRRGAVVGIWGGIAGLAIAGGPLAGGAVVQGLSWHWIFWINVPIGLVTAVASSRLLPESRGPAGRLDLPAVPLVAGGAVALAWGLARASGSGWADAWVIGSVLAGLALLGGFVLRERHAAAPMLPMRLLRIRAFAAANASGFLMSGATFSAAFLTSQYFQLGAGYGPLATGLRLLPWTGTMLLVAPLSGALADRIGTRPLMAGGLTLQAGGLAWVAWVASGAGGYGRFVLPLIVAGVGISTTTPAVAAAALGSVPPPDVGRASGVNSTLQRFGGAFGIAVTAAVFTAQGQLGSPAGVVAGFRPALAVSALLSLAGAGVAVAVGRRGGPRAAATAPADRALGGAGVMVR